MKKALLVVIVSFLANLVFPAWHEDYKLACDKAGAENKSIFIYFTGSDYCPWCKKFASEILDNPKFQESTAKYFEFVYVDFPSKKSLSEKQYLHNKNLKEKYGVSGFPSVVLTDVDGTVIAKRGYMTIGGEKYAENIIETVKQYNELKKKDLTFLNDFDLKSAYKTAKSMGNDLIIERALEEGIKKDGKLYFLFEKYTSLLREQKLKEAEEIRKQIVETDPNNFQKVFFRLALIDFEELAKDKNILPSEVIKPLVEYIQEFGKKDKENLWRLEMVISQFLATKGLLKEAIGHARASCKAAPMSIRKDLIQSILYLKHKIDAKESLAETNIKRPLNN